MASTAASPNLGFLTLLHETGGHLGGYLVTNQWGRPLEFRLSTAVQPNRIQQILYGPTLHRYIAADLIGKTLVEKCATAAQYLFTDREPVLDLRLHVEMPVIWLATSADPAAVDLAEAGGCVRPASRLRGPIFCHPKFPADQPAAGELLDRLEGTLDLTEPFARIREAMAEARKMGVTSRG